MNMDVHESETAILRQILDWLTAHNIFHWRVALGGVRHGGVRKRNPMTGFPDICGVLPKPAGRMFVIEVKRPKEYLTPGQKAWQAKLQAHGVLHVVARSTDDLEEILNNEIR